MMTSRIEVTEDDVDAVGFGAVSREQVDTLLAWVRDSERFELVPPLTVDYPLCMAADFLIQLGDLEAAWDVASEGAEHPGADPYSLLSALVEVRLRQGRVEEARTLTDAARRDPYTDPMVAERLGELFESQRLERDALRWFVIGMRLLEAAGAADSIQYEVFAAARFRVRRAADLPWDMIDRDDERSQQIFGVTPPD